MDRSYDKEDWLLMPDEVRNLMAGDRFYFKDENFFENSRNWNWFDCEGIAVLKNIQQLVDITEFENVKAILDSSKFYLLEMNDHYVDVGNRTYDMITLVCLVETSDGEFYFGSANVFQSSIVYIESVDLDTRLVTLNKVVEMLVKKLVDSEGDKKKTLEIIINLVTAVVNSLDENLVLDEILNDALHSFDDKIEELINYIKENNPEIRDVELPELPEPKQFRISEDLEHEEDEEEDED